MTVLPDGFVMDAPTAPPQAPAVPAGFTLDHPSLWEDIPKSAGIGLVKGAIGMIGAPADAGDATAHATQWATSKLTGKEPEYKTGRQTIEDLARRVPVIGGALAQYADRKLSPSSEELTKDIEAVSGKVGLGDKLYTPQTAPGQYAQTAASFVPQVLAGGEPTVGNVLKYAVAPGVASEAAGQATKGTKLEPFARIAAALGVSGLAALFSKPGTAGQLMKDAGIDHLSEADMGKVADLMESGNVTLPEAIQHVTNGATNVADLQRVVEQSRKGGPIMKDFLAERAGKNATAMSDALDQVGPQTTEPFEIAPKVQGAAQGALDETRQTINEAAQPHYDASKTDLIPDTQFDAIKDNPAFKVALSQVRNHPILGPTVEGLPDNAIPVIDAAKKHLSDMYESAMEATKPQRFLGSEIAKGQGSVVDAAKAASPEYAQALDIGAQGRQNILNPLERSPTGRLAAADTFPQQAKVIFDPNPLPGSEKAIGDAVATVARADPDAARALVRTHLEQTFNEATQRLQAGENQWGGAKFAAIIKGNPQQAKNLEAAIRALPDGDATWAGFRRTMDVMEAQGRRLPANSATTFNQQIMDALGKPGDAMTNVMTLVASPPKAFSFVRNAYEDFRRGRNTEILARLFTDPDAVRSMKDLTKYSPQSTASHRIVAGLVGKAYVDSATAGRGISAAPPNEPDTTAQNVNQ